MTMQMTPRGPDRRSGVSSYFTSPHNDRRRPKFERRGTVPAVRPLTPGQLLYGERRQNPDER
jgi:hypothetical protein